MIVPRRPGQANRRCRAVRRRPERDKTPAGWPDDLAQTCYSLPRTERTILVERRCWAITRRGPNLSRCGRVGDWFIYCDQHRWQPVVILFLLFTVLGTIASYRGAGWFSRSRPLAPPWVRITDTHDLTFGGGLAVLPGGRARGTVSEPRSRVFLLMRVVRACWGAFDCMNYVRRSRDDHAPAPHTSACWCREKFPHRCCLPASCRRPGAKLWRLASLLRNQGPQTCLEELVNGCQYFGF